MSKLILIVRVLTALGLLAMTPQARAEEPPAACAAHGDVVRKLADRYGEVRTGVGLHRQDSVVEVFTSARTGTWTIVVTGADGMACLLAAGQRWEQFREPAAVANRAEQGA